MSTLASDTLIAPAIRKSSGAHYTPKILAEFVASKIVEEYLKDVNSSIVRICDPAAGDGALLFALIQELRRNKINRLSASGFDTNPEACTLAEDFLTSNFPETTVSFHQQDFLEMVSNNSEGEFFAKPNPQFDLVIANPPYVRTQVMGAEKSQEVAKQFDLSGRVDLYHAFIQAIANIIRPGGLVGLIVSNRFMTTRSGASVREWIKKRFDILHIWDLGDTQLFEAAVLPAVLLLRGKHTNNKITESKFTSIYSCTNGKSSTEVENVIDALTHNGLVKVDDRFLNVEQGVLSPIGNDKDVWRLSTRKKDDWLNQVDAKTFCKFGDIGKIRVGVKTTADEVFIGDDWAKQFNGNRPELLRPLTTHHIAQRWRAKNSNPWQILYPYTSESGRKVLMNLSRFPKTQRYLESHRSRLEGRSYVVEAGREWYEIWVPQNPALWEKPKLVFRDISVKPTFWIDLDKTVVNGDCYWLVANDSHSSDLLWLALAIGNSTFSESFYDQRFNNKLYSGRRRFITQYVEHFPLPNPNDAMSRKIVALSKQAYQSFDHSNIEMDIDDLVWKVFGLGRKKVLR